MRSPVYLCLSLTAALCSLNGCGRSSGIDYGGEPSSAGPPGEPAVGGTSGNGGQAGVLTAGDWDDNLNFSLYQKFLSVVPEGAVKVDAAQRVLLRVRTSDGKPVAAAQVSVGDGTTTYVRATTASDGRMLFFRDRDRLPQGTALTLQVAAPSDQPGVSPVSRPLAAGDSELEVVLPGATSRPLPALDLAFVVDATGSMGDEISYLKAEVSGIAQKLRSDQPGLDLRYSLIVYRDRGDSYVVRPFAFTSDLTTFQSELNEQGAAGGGDWPEAMEEAVAAMNQLSWRSGNVLRLAFLIADAPPHPENASTLLSHIEASRRAGIKVYPIGASGVSGTAEYLMRAAAQATLGRYIFLTDDSGVGNPHEAPKIPCYEVQLLKNVMLRALNGELSGARPPASANDLLRTVGDPKDGMCTLKDGSKAYL